MTQPRRCYPEEHPAVMALSRINANPGSLLDDLFIVEHEAMLREYGMLPDLSPGAEPPPNPARSCYDAALTARDKAGQAARRSAQGQDAAPVWREVYELLQAACQQAEAAQLQVFDFTHHDVDFLLAAWNSIRRDLIYAQNLVAQENRLSPKDPGHHPHSSWPVNRQASLVEALAPISRLSAYDQAALLRQLADRLLLPLPDSSPKQQSQMEQAARDAAEAAADLMFHASANPGEPGNFTTLKPLE